MTPDSANQARVLLDSYDRVLPVAREQLGTVTDLAAGEAIQRQVVAARCARGERRLGYKIGFTNRTIWPRYGVAGPIWAPIYDTTVEDVPQGLARIDAQRYVEPRIEPEIVIGLARTPEGSGPEQVAAAVGWVAHGFEIVQSAYPGWQFSAAEGLAAQGLHGRLLIGPRMLPLALCATLDELPAHLSGLSLQLFLQGRSIDRGVGANVLDGPLQAIGWLIRAFEQRGIALAPGDILTTGTITDAHPIANGQRWHTLLDGTALPGLALELGTH